jgi:putative solute:sodium symporter small subunit
MNDHAARDSYRQQSLILAAVLLTGLTGICLAVIVSAPALNQYHFLRFPLGFYLLAQVLPIAIAGAAFWYAKVQERHDQELTESGEF